MPSSSFKQITKIVEIITALNPQSVLDIGIGFGKYRFLAREYLELWDGRYQYDRDTWRRKIDGVEAYKQYVTPVHEYIYDTIFVGDAKEIVPGLSERYDLVLLVDVLEHLEKADGIALMGAILCRAKGVLICVPRHVANQGAAFGNPYKTHRAQWNRQDFRKLGDSVDPNFIFQVAQCQLR